MDHAPDRRASRWLVWVLALLSAIFSFGYFYRAFVDSGPDTDSGDWFVMGLPFFVLTAALVAYAVRVGRSS